MSDQRPLEASTTEASTTEATINQRPSTKGVALVLAAVAVIAGGVSYGVASWQSRSASELKDALASAQTTIQNVNAALTKLREENSASLAGLRAENRTGLDQLRAENAELRSRLAAAEARVATAATAIAKTQQRDPDAIYQMGAEVGRVVGAHEDRAASTVTFESIEGGNFDRAQEFDYRDLTLVVKRHKSALTSFTSRGVQTQLTGVEATIVKTRAAP